VRERAAERRANHVEGLVADVLDQFARVAVGQLLRVP